MTDALDDLTALQIDIAAVRFCTERRDFDPMIAPGYQMKDNDYRAAIREVFADTNGYEDWMVEPLLIKVKQSVADREAVQGICDRLVGSIW